MAKSLKAPSAAQACLGACMTAALSACAVGPTFHAPAPPKDTSYGKAPQSVPAILGRTG